MSFSKTLDSDEESGVLIFQNAKYLHPFVSVPCLAEADAALVLVKYEIISADLMLDYAHISMAKQCGWCL